jgi:two-component system, NarL family, nitrate/nitrite response regulator NarP
MIADPNQLLLEGLRRALEHVDDIEVVGATHVGSQLVALVERRRPEIVVLDLAMRTDRGQCCLDALQAAHPDVKVVVFSGAATEREIRSVLERGARAFVVKSIDPQDIPSALRHAYQGTVFHAVGGAPSPDDELRTAGLTNREITMLKGLARGLSNRALSQELWVTEQTVKFHLGNLYRKLGVSNRLAAASYAHAHGVLDG